MSTILEIAKANKSLSIMVRSLKAADLEEVLNGHGPFTILAPVNMAFSKLEPGVFDELMKPSNKEKLSAIMSFHVVTGKNLADMNNGQKLKTVNGQELSVTVRDGEVYINGAKLLARNMQGSNGVVHSMDAVNIPL
ncbi:MAG TPA: fasciclin domain-containing protein [Chitinophagaceae bacterium]|nr:fasciclin domain-containing protein [Chitinophagaceae bacterium]